MRRVLIVLVAIAVSAIGMAACKPIPPSPPNVVFVLIDDARFDQLGQVADLKPDGGFDWVRDHGVQFSKMWDENNLCCPARTTILTGLTSNNHGQHDNTTFVDRQDTLPVWLQQQKNYCTGFTGKYLNPYNATKPRPAGWTYWEPLTSRLDDEYGYRIMGRDGTTSTPGDFITDHLAAVSHAQLDDCLNAEKPAFIALWPFSPHYGSNPEPDYADVPVSWTNIDPTYNEADTTDKPGWLNAAYPTPRDEIAPDVSFDDWNQYLYVTGIQTMLSVDDALRGLIDDLAVRGKLDSTLIILASDNGQLLGEHRLSKTKYVAYEAAQPTVWIAGPGFSPGTTSDAYISDLDFTQTVLTTTGTTHATDGRGIQAVMGEGDLGRDRFLPLYVDDVNGATVWPQAQGVRTWRYKYLTYADASEELYDLQVDPFEEASVHADPTYAAVKLEMQALLGQAQSCSGDSCRASAPLVLQG